MRLLGSVLGVLLIVLCVALGAGGVALRSQADPSPVAPPAPAAGSEEPLDAALGSDSSQGICSLPEPTQRRVTLPFPTPREGDVMFTLNTRGYNYTGPDQYRPVVPKGVAPADIKKRAHKPASQ